MLPARRVARLLSAQRVCTQYNTTGLSMAIVCISSAVWSDFNGESKSGNEKVILSEINSNDIV